MTASELLQEVWNLGIHILPEGGQLRVGPKRALSEELIAQLREHKAELLELLDPNVGLRVDQALGGRLTAEPVSFTGSEILAMRLNDFAAAKLVIRVRCELLGESVIFAADNLCIDPGERCVVYRAKELQRLLGLSDQEIRVLHHAKKTFGGTIEVN